MDLNQAISYIQADHGLSDEQKDELLSEEGKKKLAMLLSGASGAALGFALAKFKKMDRTAQVILSTLGFGAGVLIYKYYTREKYLNYNDKTQTYQIDN
jgi:hypothetical protein